MQPLNCRRWSSKREGWRLCIKRLIDQLVVMMMIRARVCCKRHLGCSEWGGECRDYRAAPLIICCKRRAELINSGIISSAIRLTLGGSTHSQRLGKKKENGLMLHNLAFAFLFHFLLSAGGSQLLRWGATLSCSAKCHLETPPLFYKFMSAHPLRGFVSVAFSDEKVMFASLIDARAVQFIFYTRRRTRLSPSAF